MFRRPQTANGDVATDAASSQRLPSSGWRQALRRLLGYGRSLEAASHERWELAPEEVTEVAPAVHDPEDLGRVTGVWPGATLELEWLRIRGGPVHHAATVAYRLRPAALDSGVIRSAGYRERLLAGSAGRRLPRWWTGSHKNVVMPQAVLASTSFGHRYFGHWLSDDLPLLSAAAGLGVPVAPAFPLTGHQRGYLGLTDTPPTYLDAARFDELIVLQDYSQNSYKAQRYQQIRANLRRQFNWRPHPGVFLMRKRTGTPRWFANEQDVADALQRQGLTALCPEEHDWATVVQACLGARIVIGLEGSQLIHGLYGVDDGGAWLVIQAPYHFNNVTKGYTDALGLRYGFIVGHGSRDGFTVDIDALRRLMDRLLP